MMNNNILQEKLKEILLKWLLTAEQHGDIISWRTVYGGYEIEIAYLIKENGHRFGISVKCEHVNLENIKEISRVKIKQQRGGFTISSEVFDNVIVNEEIIKDRADRLFWLVKIALAKEAEWKDFSEIVDTI